MTRSRLFKAATWLAAAVVILAALYSGLWVFAAHSLEQKTERWFDGRRQEGATVMHGPPSQSGFPGRVAVTFPDFAMAGTVTDPDWSWRTKAVRVFANPMSFGKLFVDLAGDHEIAGRWLDSDAPLALAATRAELALTLDMDGGLTDARMDSAGVTARRRDTSPLFNVEHVMAAITLSGAQTAGSNLTSRVVIEAGKVELPDVLPPALARTVESFRLTLDLKGRVSSGPLPQVLEAWRAAGGDIEIRDFALHWPPLSMTASGTVALDEALQPIGAFTAKLRGFPAAIDMLVAEDLMENREASIARGVFTLLARTPSTGGEPELSLSLTAQGRKLFAGPVTLMDMPEVKWRTDLNVP